MATAPDPDVTGSVVLIGRPVRRRGRRTGHWGTEVLLVGTDRRQLDERRVDVETHGYRVATTDDPRRAVALVVALRPDVVVVDASMLTREAPACRRLRDEAATLEIPIVVLGQDARDHATRATLMRHIETFVE